MSRKSFVLITIQDSIQYFPLSWHQTSSKRSTVWVWHRKHTHTHCCVTARVTAVAISSVHNSRPEQTNVVAMQLLKWPRHGGFANCRLKMGKIPTELLTLIIHAFCDWASHSFLEQAKYDVDASIINVWGCVEINVSQINMQYLLNKWLLWN